MTVHNGVGVFHQKRTPETVTTDYNQSSSREAPFQTELLGTQKDADGVASAIPLLPATYRHRHKIQVVSSTSPSPFLEYDLDVSRLNIVHQWLWLVGLPTSPRPLHYQLLKRREIVLSEQLDLHLVWSPARIFIKPLPRYLLSIEFWQAHICPSPHLYETALGFLLSYVALIERESDFRLATTIYGLIPPETKWSDWLIFAEQVLSSSQGMTPLSSTASSEPQKSPSPSTLEPHPPVNPRFYYGELRLGRLNWIYRLCLGKPRGYLSGCTTYGAFVRENLNSLITLFAYTTIVLSAMQVGLGTQFLADDYAFGMASYVFSVFSILFPLLALLAILLVLGFIFVVNLLRTLAIRRKRRKLGAGV